MATTALPEFDDVPIAVSVAQEQLDDLVAHIGHSDDEALRLALRAVNALSIASESLHRRRLA